MKRESSFRIGGSAVGHGFTIFDLPRKLSGTSRAQSESLVPLRKLVPVRRDSSLVNHKLMVLIALVSLTHHALGSQFLRFGEHPRGRLWAQIEARVGLSAIASATAGLPRRSALAEAGPEGPRETAIIAGTLFILAAIIAIALGRANRRNRALTRELLLRNRELEQFESIIESLTDPILSLDTASYRITSWNKAAERLYGYTEEEALRETVMILFPPGAIDQTRKHLERARAGEPLSNFETTLLHKSGQPVEVALTLSPIRPETAGATPEGPQSTITNQQLPINNPVHPAISVITHDLSDRKRAEHALSQERFLVETMMDNIPDHIYFKDRESRFIRVNKAMAGRFRLKYWGDAVGKSDFDFFTAEHAQQAFDDEQQIIRTGKAMIDREEKETWPDESVSWVSTTKQCLLDRLGNTIGTFGLSRDITARKAAEQALADKAEELARSNRELEQFAYVASHDLQEPLRMIASYTQLLARRYQDKLDKDASEFIGYAVEGATRMQVLINDLLNYSRLGTRGKPFAPTDCNEVLTRALENLKITIEDAKATVKSSPLPEILGDGTQLTQLFQNLVSNAVKFSGDKPPEVHISAALKSIPAGRASSTGPGPNPQSAIENPQSKEWVFSVRDNGIGIEPQYFERIFVIFQRLHTREQYPGTGIGLAVCKKIVERHGGQIWVESSPGKGTNFCFTIPQLQSEP